MARVLYMSLIRLALEGEDGPSPDARPVPGGDGESVPPLELRPEGAVAREGGGPDFGAGEDPRELLGGPRAAVHIRYITASDRERKKKCSKKEE